MAKVRISEFAEVLAQDVQDTDLVTVIVDVAGIKRNKIMTVAEAKVLFAGGSTTPSVRTITPNDSKTITENDEIIFVTTETGNGDTPYANVALEFSDAALASKKEFKIIRIDNQGSTWAVQIDELANNTAIPNLVNQFDYIRLQSDGNVLDIVGKGGGSTTPGYLELWAIVNFADVGAAEFSSKRTLIGTNIHFEYTAVGSIKLRSDANDFTLGKTYAQIVSMDAPPAVFSWNAPTEDEIDFTGALNDGSPVDGKVCIYVRVDL